MERQRHHFKGIAAGILQMLLDVVKQLLLVAQLLAKLQVVMRKLHRFDSLLGPAVRLQFLPFDLRAMEQLVLSHCLRIGLTEH